MMIPPKELDMPIDVVTGVLVLLCGALLSVGVWVGKNLVAVRTTLIGADGKNGVRGELRSFKQEYADDQRDQRAHRDIMQESVGDIKSRLAVIENHPALKLYGRRAYDTPKGEG